MFAPQTSLTTLAVNDVAAGRMSAPAPAPPPPPPPAPTAAPLFGVPQEPPVVVEDPAVAKGRARMKLAVSKVRLVCGWDVDMSVRVVGAPGPFFALFGCATLGTVHVIGLCAPPPTMACVQVVSIWDKLEVPLGTRLEFVWRADAAAGYDPEAEAAWQQWAQRVESAEQLDRCVCVCVGVGVGVGVPPLLTSPSCTPMRVR